MNAQAVKVVPAAMQVAPKTAPPLPSSRLEFGLSNQPSNTPDELQWMTSSGVPWMYNYTYLSGGVLTPANQGWETWNSPAGAYALNYMTASTTAPANYFPVLTYYEMCQSGPLGPNNCYGNDVAADWANISSASTMAAYYANFKLLMQQAAAYGKPVMVHVEPDFWAFMQQRAARSGFTLASQLSAQVKSSGFTDLAAYNDNLQGFACGLLHLRDLYGGGNVVMALHASSWASGVDIGSDTSTSLNIVAEADSAAAFLNSSCLASNPYGGSTYDAVFNDPADHDAASSGNWWDASNATFPNFNRYLAWVSELHVKTARPQLMWQVPIGNQYFLTMNNSYGHFQDNRAEYFLNHTSQVFAAGVVGVMFGSGNAGQTENYDIDNTDGITNGNGSPTSGPGCNACNTHVSNVADNDGGYLRMAVAAYYAGSLPPPTVTTVAPNNGPAAGGTPVVITGTKFTGATAVKFGSISATFAVNSATQVTATSPAGSAGTVDVSVTVSGVTSGTGAADHFTYNAPPPPAPTVTTVTPNNGAVAGGTSVTITGTNFTSVTAVKFGGVTATFTPNSVTQVTATSPAGSAGTVDVTVVASGGTSATGAADHFTYNPPPPVTTVTSVVPNNGPVVGGTSVTITGTNFTGATAVAFGLVAAGSYTVNSATQIAATSPAGAGIVDVRVTTSLGRSAITGADQFTYLAAPPAPVNVVALAGETSALVTWTAPVLPGGTPSITGYSVTGAPGGLATVGGGTTSVVVSGLTDAASYIFTVIATNSVGNSPPSVASNAVVPGRGAYHALAPTRILDTRNGTGGVPVAPLGAGATLNVQVTGRGGVPSSGVSAVVINVTVTTTTAPGYLTVWPAGEPRPLASNLNWVPGATVANLVEVALGVGGQVTVYNSLGTADVIVDVAGYVATPTLTLPAAGLYNPVVPNRVLDTRNGTGGLPLAPLGPGQTISIRVAGTQGIPSSGVLAVVLNVTVTNPTMPSFLTVFPTGTVHPLASNLNFVAGQTVANRVIVLVGTNPQTATGGWVSFFNNVGTTDVIADVGGWFTDAGSVAGGSTFVGVTPARVLDTRITSNTLGPTSTMVLPVAGHGGVPAMNAAVPPAAVVLNVTVTNPTGASFLTAWPDGTARPVASDLNYVSGLTVPNLVVVKLGANGSIDLYNAIGTTDAIVDVVGWYG